MVLDSIRIGRVIGNDLTKLAKGHFEWMYYTGVNSHQCYAFESANRGYA